MKTKSVWFLLGALTTLLVLGLSALLTLPAGPPRVVSITATSPGAHLVHGADSVRFQQHVDSTFTHHSNL